MRVASALEDSGVGGCLLVTETISAIAREIEPGQSRDLESFFRAAMAAVPEAIESIGVLAAFGHKAGIDDQACSCSDGITSVMALLLNDTQSKVVAYQRTKVLS